MRQRDSEGNLPLHCALHQCSGRSSSELKLVVQTLLDRSQPRLKHHPNDVLFRTYTWSTRIHEVFVLTGVMRCHARHTRGIHAMPEARVRADPAITSIHSLLIGLVSGRGRYHEDPGPTSCRLTCVFRQRHRPSRSSPPPLCLLVAIDTKP